MSLLSVIPALLLSFFSSISWWICYFSLKFCPNVGKVEYEQNQFSGSLLPLLPRSFSSDLPQAAQLWHLVYRGKRPP